MFSVERTAGKHWSLTNAGVSGWLFLQLKSSSACFGPTELTCFPSRPELPVSALALIPAQRLSARFRGCSATTGATEKIHIYKWRWPPRYPGIIWEIPSLWPKHTDFHQQRDPFGWFPRASSFRCDRSPSPPLTMLLACQVQTCRSYLPWDVLRCH